MSRDILLKRIDPDPDQPRTHFDQTRIDELAQSMDASGQAVPILVRPAGDRFIIVHGERRWRAATQLGWDSIRAEIRELQPQQARMLSLVENLQRDDLTPTEEALAYKSILETGTTQTELGQNIGKGQSYIATKLRFLNLPDEVQQALDDGAITEGHAKQLLRIDDTGMLLQLYREAVDDNLTVKALRHKVSKGVDILEARRKRALSDYSTSDKELLLAIGCEPAWNDYWPAEDFEHTDRMTGIMARFLYITDRRYDFCVYAHNFDIDGEIAFESAAMGMQRERAGELAHADLVFVNFSAYSTPEPVLESLTDTKADAIIIARIGTQEIGRRPIDGNVYSILDGFRTKGYARGVDVACTLAPLPLPEYEYAHVLEKAPEDTFIPVYERWGSFSKDYATLSRMNLVYSKSYVT